MKRVATLLLVTFIKSSIHLVKSCQFNAFPVWVCHVLVFHPMPPVYFLSILRLEYRDTFNGFSLRVLSMDFWRKLYGIFWTLSVRFRSVNFNSFSKLPNLVGSIHSCLMSSVLNNKLLALGKSFHKHFFLNTHL